MTNIRKILLYFAAALVAASCDDKQTFDAMGRFEADDVVVSAESAGKLLYLDVTEGTEIEEGSVAAITDTVLLSLERRQIEAQIDAQLSSSPDIRREASSLREQIAKQKKEEARFAQLVADGAVPSKQLDDIRAEIKVLEGRLDALLSRLGNSRASISSSVAALRVRLEQTAELISRCYVKSPVTGVVLGKYAERGEYVQPGKPLFRIADMDKIYLRSYFTSTQLSSVRLGDKVRVVADFGGGERREYQGTVQQIASESEFTPKTIQTKDSRADLVYAVRIAVRNDGRLKIGFTGEVYL